MFGRSSNAVKGMNDIQRIKLSGGTANLSFSQIVVLICNGPDAKKNLSPEEFDTFSAIFSSFRKLTKCNTVDINGYFDMCNVIINSFEKYFPYLLVDGEHSEDLELRNQIKIRKLFADGYNFKDALLKYENEYDSIPPYLDYDPVKHIQGKHIFDQMADFLSEFIAKFLFTKASLSDFGFLSGVADAIFLIVGERYLQDIKTTEHAVTLYTMLSFAISDYSDGKIESIMKKRMEIATKYYQENHSKPIDQIIKILSMDLVEEYRDVNPEINEWAVRKALDDYYKNMYAFVAP